MNIKTNPSQKKGFSLVGSPLKSARKMLGFEREVARKVKYDDETPDYLKQGEFPAVDLENDPIAKLLTTL